MRGWEFGSAIEKDDLKDCDIKKGDIVLFKTKNSSLKLDEFKENFIAVGNSGAKFLAGMCVKAVGVDYLSVERYNPPKGGTHDILIPKGILVYEGLDLSKVKEGILL